MAKRPLGRVFQWLEKPEHFFQFAHFKRDIIERTFGLANVSRLVGDITLGIIELLTRDCVGAFCLRYTHETAFTMLAAVTVPLKQLPPRQDGKSHLPKPEQFINLVKDIAEKLMVDVNSHTICLGLVAVTIEAVWQQLLETLAFVEDPAVENAIDSALDNFEHWLIGASLLLKVPSLRNLVEALPLEKYRDNLGRINSIFLAVMCRPKESLKAVFLLLRTNSVVDRLREIDCEEGDAKIFAVESAIIDCLEFNPSSQLAYFQDVIGHSLHIDAGAHANVVSTSLLEAMRTLCDLCVENYARYTNHEAILRRLPLSWLVAQLTLLFNETNNRYRLPAISLLTISTQFSQSAQETSPPSIKPAFN